jgi:hypothetical protein
VNGKTNASAPEQPFPAGQIALTPLPLRAKITSFKRPENKAF